MSNYPDDIQNYNNDSRSPLYDDSFDVAIEELEDHLFSLIYKDVNENRGNMVDSIIKDELGCDFDYLEFLLECLGDECESLTKFIIFGISDSSDPCGAITDSIVNTLTDEISEYLLFVGF